jgi:hypothetical protein
VSVDVSVVVKIEEGSPDGDNSPPPDYIDEYGFDKCHNRSHKNMVGVANLV